MKDEDEIKAIITHAENLNQEFGDPISEYQGFNNLIYNRIRRLDLKFYSDELLNTFLGIFEREKIRAAKADIPLEGMKYAEEIISKSNEQIDNLKKILNDRQNERRILIKDELDKKRFKWQKISVTIAIIAIIISFAAFIFSIVFNLLHG